MLDSVSSRLLTFADTTVVHSCRDPLQPIFVYNTLFKLRLRYSVLAAHGLLWKAEVLRFYCLEIRISGTHET